MWYVWLLVLTTGILSIFTPKIKGYFGEKSVAFFLSSLDESKYKIINNIMLQNGNKTTQIDHVVVSNYRIFVIETKNYKGWIIGNEYDDYWKQIIYKKKEQFHNPLKQNYGHVQVLKEKLSDYPNINFIPIVVFTIKADLKVNTKSEVVYTVNLTKTIRKHVTEQITDADKESIYTKLLSLNVDNADNRKAHVQAIHNNFEEKRNQMSNDICPKCGGELIEKNGKYGRFKGCKHYPKCRFTLKIL